MTTIKVSEGIIALRAIGYDWVCPKCSSRQYEVPEDINKGTPTLIKCECGEMFYGEIE